MPEPTTSSGLSLAAVSIALLGPLAGPYVVIVFAALAGALWPLSAAETMGRAAGAWLLLRCTLTAVVLTGALSVWLQSYWAVSATDALAPVAFAIGALGNGWRPVFDGLGAALQAIAQRLGGNANGGPRA
ncbi:hypothetical protein [Acidovorax lacteus]|uniref:Phage holin family protein n=1 Tax=Acidovorax lacteus TaxID=1924988 RepID=A0ABP8LCB3_9BURK